MYWSAFKQGPDPTATGFLKSALPGSRNYSAERGVVKCPLNVKEGAQHNPFLIQGLFQSMNNLEITVSVNILAL
jgi:hypothetical protein